MFNAVVGRIQLPCMLLSHKDDDLSALHAKCTIRNDQKKDCKYLVVIHGLNGNHGYNEHCHDVSVVERES